MIIAHIIPDKGSDVPKTDGEMISDQSDDKKLFSGVLVIAIACVVCVCVCVTLEGG